MLWWRAHRILGQALFAQNGATSSPIGKLNSLLDGGGELAVAALALGSLALGLAIAHRRAEQLLALLVLSAALVGSQFSIVDSAATLMRWTLIGAVGLVGLISPRPSQGKIIQLFWLYVAIGVVFLARAAQPMWQIQRAMLLIGTATALPLAASAIAMDAAKFNRLLRAIAASGAVITVASLPMFISEFNAAARFSGFASGAPQFALVTGTLLPFGLWAALQSKRKRDTLAWGFVFFSGATLLATSGQRTGTVGAIVGIAPLLLLRLVGKRKLLLAAVLGLAGALAAAVRYAAPQKAEFVTSRYGAEAGLSDRDLIWESVLTKIREQPFLGAGIGGAEEVIPTSFHNAYLEVWYNTGILGLIAFCLSQLLAMLAAWRGMRGGADESKKDHHALGLGVLLGFVTMSMFESFGSGASNISMIAMLIVCGLLGSWNRAPKKASGPLRLSAHWAGKNGPGT